MDPDKPDTSEPRLIWLVVDAGAEKRPIPGTYKTEPFLKTRRLFSTAEAADDHATSLGGTQVSRTVGVESRCMSGPVDVWSIALLLPRDLAVRLSTVERLVAERDRLHRDNRAADNSIRHLKEEIAALKAGIVAYRVGGGWPETWEKAHGSLVSPTAQETTG
jgi:hypothetical protein